MDFNENEYDMYDLYDQNRHGIVFHPWGWWVFFPPHMMPPQPPRPPRPPRPPQPPGPPRPPQPPGPPPRPQPREYM